MLENLQLLRAFAALVVVLFHALATGSEYGRPAGFLRVFDGLGRECVDLFFVISGFVLVYAQQQRPKGPSAFLLQRIVRIAPLYWLLTLGWYGLAQVLSGSFRHGAPSPGRLITSLLFLTHTVYRDLPVVFVGWTLEYELVFYVVFAMAIGFGRPMLGALFTGAVLLTLVAMGEMRWIAIEFFLGMLCAHGLRLVRDARMAGALAVTGGALFLAPLVPVPGAEWTGGVSACLLVTGLAATPALRWKAGHYLGNASYSIYLVQVFSIPVCYKLITRYFAGTPGDVAVIAATLFTVLAGCLLYEGVEKRLPRKVTLNEQRRVVEAAQVG